MLVTFTSTPFSVAWRPLTGNRYGELTPPRQYWARLMVYISKVYTRFGDAGDTMLADGSTVPKTSLRVNGYGEVDELNAVIGLLRLELTRESKGPELCQRVDTELGRIQQELFNLGSELATPAATQKPPRCRIDPRHIERLEGEIDAHNDELEPLKSFILPGGGPAASFAHLGRTVCRRAERRVCELAGTEPLRPEALRYLNRLSDYLFVISRALSSQLGYAEVLWDQKGT